MQIMSVINEKMNCTDGAFICRCNSNLTCMRKAELLKISGSRTDAHGAYYKYMYMHNRGS